MKSLARGHTAARWSSWDLNSQLPAFKGADAPSAPHCEVGEPCGTARYSPGLRRRATKTISPSKVQRARHPSHSAGAAEDQDQRGRMWLAHLPGAAPAVSGMLWGTRRRLLPRGPASPRAGPHRQEPPHQKNQLLDKHAAATGPSGSCQDHPGAGWVGRQGSYLPQAATQEHPRAPGTWLAGQRLSSLPPSASPGVGPRRPGGWGRWWGAKVGAAGATLSPQKKARATSSGPKSNTQVVGLGCSPGQSATAQPSPRTENLHVQDPAPATLPPEQSREARRPKPTACQRETDGAGWPPRDTHPATLQGPTDPLPPPFSRWRI